MMVSRVAATTAALALSGLGVLGLQSAASAGPAAAAKPKPTPSASPGSNCPNPNGHYPPGQCKPKGNVGDDTVEHGQKEHVHGQDWQPNSNVKVYAQSTPIYLDTFRADSAGVVDGDVVIPASLSLGAHHIVFRGLAANGKAATVPVPIQVIAATGAGGGGNGTGIGPLPRTGAEIAAVGLFGVVLVGAGGVAVAGGRRRRLAA
ncbi:MAG: hypothetical protein JWP11_1161 [Frankiales bacterium]|nr:hypothetical protein [Frankiales bacterium]